MTRTFTAIASLAMLMGAGLTEAQAGNSFWLNQWGAGNAAGSAQFGNNNQGGILQWGLGNAATQTQNGNFNQAVKEWRHFQGSYDSADLRVKVDAELRAIDLLATEDARKVVEAAGSGSMARQKLEAEQERFMGTEGQKIIAQKLKALP